MLLATVIASNHNYKKQVRGRNYRLFQEGWLDVWGPSSSWSTRTHHSECVCSVYSFTGSRLKTGLKSAIPIAIKNNVEMLFN